MTEGSKLIDWVCKVCAKKDPTYTNCVPIKLRPNETRCERCGQVQKDGILWVPRIDR